MRRLPLASRLRLVLPRRPVPFEPPGTMLALSSQPSGHPMDDQAFLGRVNAALTAKSEGRLDDATTELRALVRDLGTAGKTAVGEWHRQQALGLLVDALDAAGREEECREAWEELIRLAQHALTYWQTALSAAREDFARWNRRQASGSRR